MTHPNDFHWMRVALKLAKTAGQLGEVPVGAVLIQADRLVATGFNRREQSSSPLWHAEMIVIERAAQRLSSWRLADTCLYVTLEPCLMCAGAIWQARIPRVVFAAKDPKGGAAGSLYNFATDQRLNHQTELVSAILEDEATALLQNFFQQRR